MYSFRISADALLLVGVILGSEANTMTEYDTTETLDVKGQNCPMPVVKTKQSIDQLTEDDVLEVLATDAGSMSDIAGWADTTDGVELVDQKEDGDVYKHYVRKTE
ncbi:sulfurtransferase TusA [Halalkalicoccus paucihalophilus]|uniref:Sulfurtransferase TusA n=2 Tax=Halalkalicoccus paucihalophilus TaxID=1008153 RepID=A0A151AFG1_9EURY|nr:sulfurtransferase TusA [Halalkalicoccus paucihalophilus]